MSVHEYIFLLFLALMAACNAMLMVTMWWPGFSLWLLILLLLFASAVRHEIRAWILSIHINITGSQNRLNRNIFTAQDVVLSQQGSRQDQPSLLLVIVPYTYNLTHISRFPGLDHSFRCLLSIREGPDESRQLFRRATLLGLFAEDLAELGKALRGRVR